MNIIEDMLCIVVIDVLGLLIVVNIIKNENGEVVDLVEYDFG